MSNVNLNIGQGNNENVGRQKPAEQAAPIRQQTQREERPVQEFYDPFAEMSTTQLFGQLVNPASGSEYFNTLVEGLKKANTSPAITIVPFAKEVFTDLSFSVVAIVRNNKVRLSPSAPQHTFVLAQLLIVEGTGETPRPYTNNDNPRRPYQVIPTVEDANNSLLVNLVTEHLLKQFQQDGATAAYLIDPVVIRRTFDVSKKEDVEVQLSNSVTAVETRSQVRVPGFVDFNFVKRMGSNDLSLPVTVSMTSGESRKDNQGLPIHTDAVIDVHVERNSSRRQGVVMNSPNDSRLLSQTGVMVDLVPVDPELLSENRSRGRRNRFEPEVAWAPRGVVTNIEQFLTRTGSGIWFAIASVAELGRDRTWANTFRNFKGGKDTKNLRDIGLLNIEANLDGDDSSRFGRPIDTKDPSFDERQMGILLDNTVTRAMMIAVDCATTGNQAYYTTSLYNLARGRGEARQRAHNEIVNSLRDATDGLIDKYIDLDKVSIVEGDGDLLHTGFWYDNTGRQRDLRELDNYLAIAALAGDKNAEVILQWADTWLRTDINEAQRLSDRLAILQSAASGSVTPTGTALRVTINDEVIDAFVRAMDEGKLPLISRATGNGDAFVSQRSVSRVASTSLYRGSGFSRQSTYGERSRSNGYAADRY